MFTDKKQPTSKANTALVKTMSDNERRAEEIVQGFRKEDKDKYMQALKATASATSSVVLGSASIGASIALIPALFVALFLDVYNTTSKKNQGITNIFHDLNFKAIADFTLVIIKNMNEKTIDDLSFPARKFFVSDTLDYISKGFGKFPDDFPITKDLLEKTNQIENNHNHWAESLSQTGNSRGGRGMGG